jgi:thymidine kinase
MGSCDEMDCIKISTGRLELIIGNMFSGKSTELIRRINRQKSINSKILIINYIDDNRYSDDSISTHDNVQMKSLKLKRLSDINSEILKHYDSIFIDEGQFFTDLYFFVNYLVEKCRKHVVVSGLDGDSNRNQFGDIIKLIPICDTVDKLTAYCNKCNNGTLAPFTKKYSKTNDSIIDIGGNDKYIPVCRYHYLLN